MLLNLLIWLIAILVVSLLTRERDKVPGRVDHRDVLQTQPAYRSGSATDS